MNPHRLWAIMRKEFRHVQRDRRLLYLVLISPTVMLIAFSYLFSFDSTTLRMVVLDLDRSAESRALIVALKTDPDLLVLSPPPTYGSIRERMRSLEVKLGLVIPPRFGADLRSGRTAQVQVQSDGADPLNAGVQVARLGDMISTWAQPFRATLGSNPIDLRALIWYNPDLKSSHSMVPGLLAIVLILPAMAVALAITREKELGSFESLAATPVHAGEYILGKLIPYLIYGWLGAGLAITVAILWFRVPLRGSIFDLAAFILIYLYATLGISVLLSSFLSTQSTALRAILLIFLVPSFFLTGLVIPVDPQARLTASTLPATHFVTIGRGIFLKGLGWTDLGQQLFILIAMGTIAIPLAMILFRKRVR